MRLQHWSLNRNSQPRCFSIPRGKLTQRSFTNSDLLDELVLGEKVKVQFKSADGTPIEGFVIQPPDFEEGKRYPTILDVHGGPQLQHDWGFQYESQLFAANGYLVVQPNPRGSTGYGQEFCRAIWLAWGEPDYEDVMASVDDAIERGWADPERLIVTGWSYGGMMTNHVITKTDRFKAAATGASATLYVVNYGHDQYQRWWEQELGFPWEPEARELYEKMSPFNKVENVKTPTLILCGEKDWNVPVINSEQLYLALKRLGVPTELVVYPGEGHSYFAPTHQKDVWERYLAWFEKYLQGKRLIRRLASIAVLSSLLPLVAVTAEGVHFEENVPIPMRDEIVLMADVYRPIAGGPFPVLVYRTPYGKRETAEWYDTHLAAVARGYAVVLQDVRGRYASEGEFYPYVNEGRDGYDTIEWAARQPWSTGEIGTFGLSYPAAVQWLAAIEQPPHLKAMVPAMTFSSPPQVLLLQRCVRPFVDPLDPQLHRPGHPSPQRADGSGR